MIRMAELVTLPNVTLIETGTWEASTGEVTFTAADLAAAVAAIESDPAIKAPRLRFGHTEAGVPVSESAGGFDSQPCVGKFTNLRLEDEGNALVADLVGVPKWLAEILPIAYPNRSVEAYYDVKTSTGKTHDMIVTSVAVLGTELPAVQTLDDLEILFSEEGPAWVETLETTGSLVMASRKEGAVPTRVSASIDTSDVRQAFYEQVATEDSGRYWWWLHQVYMDPQIAIAEGDNSDYWMVPYSFSDNEVEYQEPVEVFIQWVEKEGGKIAAKAAPLVSMETAKPEAVYASARLSRPAERQQAFDNNKKEAKGSMPIDTSLLTARLGLAQDATEEQINEALAAETPTPETPEVEETTEEQPETETEETEGAPETETTPASVSASGVTVDAETWERIQRDAAAGRVARDKQVKESREQFVAAAVKGGKIPPSRKAHYLSLMEKDDKGTREFLNSLAANSVPIEEIGTSEDDTDQTTRAQGTGLFPELNRDRQEA